VVPDGVVKEAARTSDADGAQRVTRASGLPQSVRYSAWLTGVYVVVSATWIVATSALAAWLEPRVEGLHRIEQVKGVGFVLVTGAVLYLGARALFRRIEMAGERLVRQERALVANERRVFAGLMAGSVAHDANNVLQALLMDVDDLASPETPRADADAIHQRLSTSVKRLVDLNRRLVQVTRQTATAHAVTLDVGVAVREAVDLVRKHPSVRGAAIELTTAASRPLAAQPGLISQIVTNLVVNAGEASGEGGRVAVRLTERPGEIRIEVHDSGPGVPMERRATLFEALTTTKPDGNGMGLFSVRACAKALGGDVGVGDSELGGACFWVSLPRADDACAVLS
jgi:two-component system NtrC family sensor kinase